MYFVLFDLCNIAKLSPNFSSSWAELVFILNFSHHPPRIVVKAPNTTQFTRVGCIRIHHNLSNNKLDMIYIHPTNEFHPSDESQQYHDLEFSTWLSLSISTYLEFLYSLRNQSQKMNFHLHVNLHQSINSQWWNLTLMLSLHLDYQFSIFIIALSMNFLLCDEFSSWWRVFIFFVNFQLQAQFFIFIIHIHIWENFHPPGKFFILIQGLPSK